MREIKEKTLEEMFLIEYEKLCQKYKMGFRGCGCCGSPFLDTIENINYDKELNKIFIGGDGYWYKRKIKGNLSKQYEDNIEDTVESYFNKKDK